MNLNLQSASNFAPKVDHLAWVLFGFCGVFVALVVFLLVFLSIRYRAGSKVDRSHPRDKASKLELSLAAIMLVFGFSTFVMSARVFYKMYTPPPGAQTVYVTAKQWMWKFQDTAGKNTINEVTVKLNEPVKFEMISEDVIHSFYVPAFRVKQDVLPGRYTTLWFTPTEVGDFLVLCTQYCGLSHSSMRAMIHVVAQNPSATAEVAHAN